MALKMLEVFEK